MYDIMYDIMSDMISLVISGMTLFLKRYIYDIIYDIINVMISFMISYVFKRISFTISYMISYKNLWYHVWSHIYPFLETCATLILSKRYDIIYDIIFFWQDHSHLPVSCAIFMCYCLQYHIHIIHNLLWYQNYMILSMILTMICPSDSSITWHHSHMMPHIWWYYSLYHGTCESGMARVGGAMRQVLHLLLPCVFSWTVTALNPRMDLLQKLLHEKCTAADL